MVGAHVGHMVFVRPSPFLEPFPVLRGAGVVLRPPTLSDYEAWAEVRAASKAQLTPYEPRWTSDELSRAAFKARLKRYQHETRNDFGHAFFVFDPIDRTLMGGITLSGVRRGVSQSAFVGYWVGTPYTRRGHATAAVRRVVDYAVAELHLHRLEAACMPRNDASLRVLEKAGFVREGLARGYLAIHGAWEDHVLLALLAEDRVP